MLTLTLAFRNLIHAGLRTWLNVLALSFSFVAIIFMQGFYDGLNDQVERATIDALYGGGQYWQHAYDPYDPLSLEDAHAPVPPALAALAASREATPILVRRGTIYPHGRFQPILVKGIDPGQTTLSIPSWFLKDTSQGIPAIIGSRMARTTGLRKGDAVTVQWRDSHGTFDAWEVTIAEVFRTPVQDIDNGQIWVPLGQLQKLMRLEGQATIIVLAKTARPQGALSAPSSSPSAPPTSPSAPQAWEFRDLGFLLQDIHQLVVMKSAGASIMYILLLALALLAIFDTQVLSIWRRRKEMGTLMALGMTRGAIIRLFTTEGAMHSLLAACVAAVYGIPLFAYAAHTGFLLPSGTEGMGFAVGERLFPVYSPPLVIGTTVLVCLVTTIVSFLPTRKIAALKPTDALRGKLS